MSKNVYFHIDELGRDAITASALKKVFKEQGVNLVYGNRIYTQKVLEKFAFAFDVIIVPRPQFLKSFNNLNINLPAIVILFTESVGRFVREDCDKYTLCAIVGEDFMEGNTKYADKVSSFCLWGEIGKLRIDKYYPEIAHKFHVTGHPRHDKRCINHKTKNASSKKAKVGLITRQGMLNDFAKRQPIEKMVRFYLNPETIYTYKNKVTGDFLLSQDNESIDQISMESVDVKILVELLMKLNDQGYEIHLKVHPRENREFWVNIVKKYNLNVILVNWKSQFSHWLKNLDYVIGPASTAFYDCCIAGVHPICTRKIYKNRDIHIKEFSEESGALMEYIDTPNSINDIMEIVNKNEKFELSDQIKQVLSKETNYPESSNSIDKIVKVSLDSIKEERVSPFMKSVYMIGFHLYGNIIVNLYLGIKRFVTQTKDQGSTFLMTKKNRKYIDSLVD